MIKSLHLTNFRRHEDLELRFDDDAQLIVINGPNGAGKSSILESIVFALYGESRQGRKNLDRLTKRGSELEGMSVELVFTVADNTYRVHRRRDGKASTAVLYSNEIQLVEGPIGVTEEITRILGMDSAGFRLAAIAQQKDLDGLASLRPAERSHMMTRLLRLDALTAARTQASSIFRRERELVSELRNDGLEQDEQALDKALQSLADAQTEQKRASESLTLLDAELAATRDVDTLWTESARNVSRISGMVDELVKQLEQTKNDLAHVQVPEAVDSEHDISQLTQESVELERKLVQAQQAAREAQQRDLAQTEISAAEKRLVELESNLSQSLPSIAELRTQRDAQAHTLGQLEDTYRELSANRNLLERDLESMLVKLQRAQQLGAQCEACGQEVSAEHQHQQVAQTQREIDDLRVLVDDAIKSEQGASAAVTSARTALTNLDDELDKAVKMRHHADLLEAERDELNRRAAAYRGQLDRLAGSAVDTDDLYARKAELALALEQAKAAAESEKQRAQALGRKDSLRNQLAATSERLESAQAEREAASPSADLQARYQERQALIEARLAEQEILNHWNTEVAVGKDRVAGLEKALEASRARRERMLKHQEVAVHAGAAGRLLSDVSERLSTMIRPSLEASISSLLATMSQGRFDAVSISDDYDILVLDDGKHRGLDELSGGEVDLVALATRLALASIVSERHGDGGIGFLILDECFGSQDPQRRSSILDALRNLKASYSQIFLISHVENIEDAADVLVSVEVSDDRSETLVTVS